MDIRAQLRSKGLTQQDVARRFSVSEATVSRWIDRHAPLPLRVVPELAGMLGVKIEPLVKAYAEGRK